MVQLSEQLPVAVATLFHAAEPLRGSALRKFYPA